MRLFARTPEPIRKDWVNGIPRNCAYLYCQEPLKGEIRRVGEAFYCNDTCASAAASLKGRLS